MKKDKRNKPSKKSSQFDLSSIKTAIDEHFYRLDGHEAVRCTLAEYAQAMLDDSQRVLAQTQVGDLRLSSIFIGIDQNFGRGSPALFETVVFGLPDELRPRWLHSTWDEAINHHRQLARSVSEHGSQYLLDEISRISGKAPEDLEQTVCPQQRRQSN